MCNLVVKGHLIKTRRQRILNNIGNDTFSQNTVTDALSYKSESIFELLFNIMDVVKLLLDVKTLILWDIETGYQSM